MLAWVKGTKAKLSNSTMQYGRLLKNQRLYVELTLPGQPLLLADLMTGSLFEPETGQCLSSSRRCIDMAALRETTPKEAQAWIQQAQAKGAAKW